MFIFLQAVVDAAVKELLALKAEFKAVSGKDWSPALASAPQAAAEKPSAAPQKTEEKSGQDNSLGAKIKEAGDKVRDLKAKKADKVNQYLSSLKLYLFYIGNLVGCY